MLAKNTIFAPEKPASTRRIENKKDREGRSGVGGVRDTEFYLRWEARKTFEDT